MQQKLEQEKLEIEQRKIQQREQFLKLQANLKELDLGVKVDKKKGAAKEKMAPIDSDDLIDDSIVPDLNDASNPLDDPSLEGMGVDDRAERKRKKKEQKKKDKKQKKEKRRREQKEALEVITES